MSKLVILMAGVVWSCCAEAQTTPTILWSEPAADVFATPLTALQLDAVALTGPPVQVALPYNLTAIQVDGQAYTGGGIDGGGYAFPGSLVPASIAWNGVSFAMGTAGAPNAVADAKISLPAGKYGTLLMLANMVNNASASATFVVTYTDGTSAPATISMSDWVNIESNPGENRVACWPYRLVPSGGTNDDSVCLNGYQVALDPTKTVASVTTPANTDYVVESMVLLPPVVPGSFHYAPVAGTVTPIGTNVLNTVFLPTDTTTYSSANASVSLVTLAPPSTNQSTVKWPTPAPITYPTPLSATQLDAAGIAYYSAQPVSLAEAYSVNVIFPDGTAFGRGGFDASGDVYSATALGSSVIYAGNVFHLGDVAVPDAATSQTIPLGQGNYSTLYLIGAAANTAEPAQIFTATYSDGSTTAASISMSTWQAPQKYAGETTVATMSYANTSSGGKVQGTYYLYGYQMALDATKTLVSLTLPSNTNIRILAASVVLEQTISVAGSYVYTPPVGTILSAGANQPLSVAFTSNDPATYTSAVGSTTITVLPASLVVEANSATRPYGTPNPAFTGSITGAVNGDVFTESISTTATTSSNAGAYAITPVAAGAGLANYQQTIEPGTLTITQVPVTMTIATSATAVEFGTSVTLSAAVASTTTGTPTGTVTFFCNGVALGSAILSGGSAVFPTTQLPNGADTITASYSGDVNFLALAGASNTLSLTVQSLDFTLTTPYGTTLTTPYGGSPQLRLHLAPVSGVYGGPVAFTFSGTLPPPAPHTTVSFSPNPVAVNAGATDVVVTIDTRTSLNAMPQRPGAKLPEEIVYALLVLPVAWVRRRKRTKLGVALLVFGLLGMAVGCGSGYAAKSFPLVVTATSGNIKHSVTITLNMEAGPQ